MVLPSRKPYLQYFKALHRIKLYQSLVLHIRVPFQIRKPVLSGVGFKDSFLVAYGIGFPGKLVLMG